MKENNKRYWWKATISFLLVLFTMPLGHALMITMEHLLSPTALHYSAFGMGAVGCNGYIRRLCRRRHATNFVGILRWFIVLDRMGGICVHVLRTTVRRAPRIDKRYRHNNHRIHQRNSFAASDVHQWRTDNKHSRRRSCFHSPRIPYALGIFRFLDDVHAYLSFQYQKRMRFLQLVSTKAISQQTKYYRSASHDTPHFHCHVHGTEYDTLDILPLADVLLRRQLLGRNAYHHAHDRSRLFSRFRIYVYQTASSFFMGCKHPNVHRHGNSFLDAHRDIGTTRFLQRNMGSSVPTQDGNDLLAHSLSSFGCLLVVQRTQEKGHY